MDSAIDLLHIDPDFCLESFNAAEQKSAADKRVATAIRVRSRIAARRAKSEAHLATILPPTIQSGDSWHVLTSGDIDSLSFLAHILAAQPLDHVTLSTWCMARDDVAQIARWLDAKRIGCLDAYVGEIFPSQYADAHELLCSTVRKCGGRVCVFRNHSKLFLCRNACGSWVIESSANINTNPRTENTVITHDRALYEHHLAYLSGIHSFARDFDDWQPQ